MHSEPQQSSTLWLRRSEIQLIPGRGTQKYRVQDTPYNSLSFIPQTCAIWDNWVAGYQGAGRNEARLRVLHGIALPFLIPWYFKNFTTVQCGIPSVPFSRRSNQRSSASLQCSRSPYCWGCGAVLRAL